MVKRKVIRQGVFETNSSSTHSLVIAKTMYEDLKLNEDYEVIIQGPFKFGWGYDEIYDIESKIAYLYLCNEHNEDALDDIKEIIIDQTGALDVIFKINENDDYSSWVDHDSVHVGRGLSKEEIKEFIFNPKSYIILDNDNDY